MGSFFSKFYYIIFAIIFLIIFISCFFTPIISEGTYLDYDLNAIESMEISEHGFVWPIPGYTKITSYFGKRTSPTAGASSYHKGMDIGAPEGTKFIAVVDGTITYTGFLGGGGYTITLSKDNMKITYCHVSPTYIVEVGQEVVQGQVIGFVGPKNVYGVVRKSI
jgi:murein DD-endopeptidase MepM/ murein hydrolase activator NlpD